MRIALLLLGFVCTGLAAGEFDAVAFYGPEHFARTAQLEGKLTLKLDSAKPPAFVDLSNSDDGPAQDRFEFTATGLVLKPASAKTTCEAEVDVGLTLCDTRINVVELDAGASVAFHLRGLDNTTEFLIEVKRDQGSPRLSIRKRTANAFAEVSGKDVAGINFKVPNTLSMTFSAAKIFATFGGVDVQASGPTSGSFSFGVAANDRRARVSDLELSVHFDEAWAGDAQARLEARALLTRLNEYCTQGLLAGLGQSKLPTQDADLKQYSAEELKARNSAMSDAVFATRFASLDSIAKGRPKLALTNFEAGVSAMLAGYSAVARERLETALAISDCSLIRLALAEACRRLHDFVSAESNLLKAQVSVEDALRPDLELLQGRLLAARGDIAGARKVLSTARAKWKNHEQLAAFAESADELAEPRLTAFGGAGPFGLTVVSDLDEAPLKKVLARLAPYTERIRYWLPDLDKKLEGTIAIYATPTGYLRAAVLVAGDSLDNVAGMFLPAGIGGGRSVIACRAFGEDELLRTLAHELWHLAVSTTAQSGMEPWLNEGMAVYVSAGQLRDGSLRFATLPTEFSAASTDLVAALADSTAAQAALEAGITRFYLPVAQRMNYAMAWALVWYHAEQDLASERTLRALLSGESNARTALKNGLAQLMPRVAKALKDRKVQ